MESKRRVVVPSSESVDGARMQGRRPARRRRRALLWIAGLLIAAAISVATAAWMAVPRPSDLLARVQDQMTADGSRPLSLSDVAPALRLAVVATEDERFYRHHGIDTLGLLRAAAYDAGHLSLAQGASTITEQLAKLVYLGGDDRSPWRKLEDAALALRIEERYPKQVILGAYLNAVYFGEGTYGVGAASERYFAVPPSRLDLAQASLLAGLIQDPTGDDPFAHPQAARYRQAEVLLSMIRNGFITTQEARRALDQPLALTGGDSLGPLPGVSLAPEPLFSGPQLAIGVLLLGIGILALVRKRFGSRVMRLLPAVVVVIGALLVARSLRAS